MIHYKFLELVDNGLRVLAFSYNKDNKEVLLGFVGEKDPIKKGVNNAITNLILNNICEKDKIMIKSAVLQSNSFTNKEGKEISSLELTIFDLDKFEEETQTQDLKENRFKRN